MYRYTDAVVYLAAASVGITQANHWTVQDWAAVGIFCIAALTFVFAVIRYIFDVKRSRRRWLLEHPELAEAIKNAQCKHKRGGDNGTR